VSTEETTDTGGWFGIEYHMKMIYVGLLTKGPDRDSSWISAFEKLGCTVIPISSHVEYPKAGLFEGIVFRVFRRLNIGSRNRKLQNVLLELAEREKPNWVHFLLPLGFDRKTIETLKDMNIVVTQYFNDDPFSSSAPFGINWKFRHALTAYDAHFVWRARDIANYRKAGAAYVEHSPPYYDPERTPLSVRLPESDKFLADVAFIGHWEGDWRVDCLDALVNSGLRVILKGGGWDKAIRGRRIGASAPVSHAFGAEYCHIYSNVIAGLCFFSKINNDTWTRRALEIVAVGGLLVCERNEEAMQYFKDREEAYFFSSIDELVAIVNELRNNPIKRERVRAAGYARLLQSDNTVLSRAKRIQQFVINTISERTRNLTSAR